MRAFLVGVLLFAVGPAFAAEKYVGSVVDVRTILAFKAVNATVQKFLPKGWELDVAATGPAKEVNIRVTFVDRLSAQDAEGKALIPDRHVTVTIPAKKKESETRGTILLVLYTSAAGDVPGPYGVAVHAKANLERKVRTDVEGTNSIEETWQFRAQDSNSLRLKIRYIRSASASMKGEALVCSAVKPDFYRIYRFEQAVDAVRSAGVDRVQKLAFKASGPKLAQLFDGSERLIGVSSVPWYARQIYLPGS